jgi:c(7)-type cytochrome triheme protein
MCHNGTKAFALAKCAACHKVKDVITFKVKETGPVLFKHSVHLQKKGDCGACHNALFKTGPNPRVSMSAMEKGKSCGACHDGKAAFTVKENCDKCHPVKELVFTDKDAGNITFSHKSHTGLYKCGECHTKLFATARSKKKVTMQEMEKGKSCGACHDGKTAFTVKENCATCHKM